MKEYKIIINQKKYKVTASGPGIAARRSIDHYLRVNLKGKQKPKSIDVKIICGSITIKVPVPKIEKSGKIPTSEKVKKNKGEGITVLGDIYEYGTY